MAKNSKRKGKVGELELARKLREYGYDTRRSVQYNGKEEEGQADLLGLPGVHIECKRTESLRLYDAINQAKRDSENSGHIPVVFHRKNNCDWVAILTLDDFMEIYREYASRLYLESVAANEERCAVCGDTIPEGRQTCPNCESKN